MNCSKMETMLYVRNTGQTRKRYLLTPPLLRFFVRKSASTVMQIAEGSSRDPEWRVYMNKKPHVQGGSETKPGSLFGGVGWHAKLIH